MAEQSEMESNELIGTVTIAANTKLSTGFNLAGYLLKVIEIPSAWSGSSLKIKIASTSASAAYKYAYKAGADLAYTVAGGKAVLVTSDIIAARWIKVESQTTEGSARTVTLYAAR